MITFLAILVLYLVAGFIYAMVVAELVELALFRFYGVKVTFKIMTIFGGLPRNGKQTFRLFTTLLCWPYIVVRWADYIDQKFERKYGEIIID